jgi:hypothetical protein
MANIVLVHGIDQQQKSADLLEASWLPALAGGVRNAGYPEIADGIVARNSVSVRMAFYGKLFLTPDSQGGGLQVSDLDHVQQALADSLSLEWLERAATQTSNDKERQTAEIELASLRGEVGKEQEGIRHIAGTAIAGLSRLRWAASIGMALAERFVNRALAQVTLYLTDETIRTRARQSVLDLIDGETVVVIGHSLGSVVAYEALHQLTNALPLFVTIGSPLGLKTIIYSKLVPQPPTYPPNLQRWVNVADRDDIIAAVPDLTNMFRNTPKNAIFEGSFTVDNGQKPHTGEFYLGKVNVGRPIGDVLTVFLGRRASAPKEVTGS